MSFRGIKYVVSLGLLTIVTGLSLGAVTAHAVDRKLKSRVSPEYPELAKRMNVTGTVKVEIVIAPNGSVKSTKVIGGHPLLVGPSVDAVKKWKYEPSSEETTETVQFNFNGAD